MATIQNSRNDIRGVRDKFGVTARHADNRIAVLDHKVMLTFGDPHHVANDGQRKARGDLFHEVALTLFNYVIHDLGDCALNALLCALNHAWREPPRNDPAHSSMSLAVHIDHVSEVFEEGFREITDVGPLPRAENFGVATYMENVGMLGDGPVSAAAREVHPFRYKRLFMERHRSLSAERGESAFALFHRSQPERDVTQFNFINRQDFTGLHSWLRVCGVFYARARARFWCVVK